MEMKSKSGWLNVIIGILFVILSFMIFSNPTITDATVIIYYGILMIVKGIASFISLFTKDRDVSGWQAILVAIVDIAVGYILVTNLYVGFISLGILVALWMLTMTIVGLTTLFSAGTPSSFMAWLAVILYIIGIFVSISLFFEVMFAAEVFAYMLGFAALNAGVLLIISPFMD